MKYNLFLIVKFDEFFWFVQKMFSNKLYGFKDGYFPFLFGLDFRVTGNGPYINKIFIRRAFTHLAKNSLGVEKG